MENVPGIRSSFGGRILREFIDKLESGQSDPKQRYLVKCNVVNAADYGVPQARKRFVLHAVRRDIYEVMAVKGVEWELPKQTHSKTGNDGMQKWVTVRTAFDGLPSISAGQR